MASIAWRSDAAASTTVIYVEKDWGHEEWLCNNEIYCAKWLVLRPGRQCSLHRHLEKDETFYVQEGVVRLEYDGETRYLCPGDSQRISPLKWHRFANLEKELAVILEVSTHHNDADVERRELSGQIG